MLRKVKLYCAIVAPRNNAQVPVKFFERYLKSVQYQWLFFILASIKLTMSLCLRTKSVCTVKNTFALNSKWSKTQTPACPLTADLMLNCAAAHRKV